MSKKVALLTGVTGQDGSYLAELLLSKGYDVHGVIRRSSLTNTGRIDHIPELAPEVRGNLHFGDLADGINHILYKVKPDEIYNLGSMSHVKVSFDIPEYTGDVTGIGVTRILEGVRKGIEHGILSKNTKFYQASSSEMFGISPPPQSEITPFNPVSPYGCAKLYGYWITKTYRTGYGLFASNGILFNHESPRRGVNFVTRKITRAAARIKLGKQSKLELGNLDAKRDWGHSKDYMEAIWLILQQDKPDDYVVSTGQYYSVLEFVIEVFKYFGLDYKDYVKYNEVLTRPNEVPALLGDSTKIRTELGWKPKYGFKDLVAEMAEADYELEKNGSII